MGYNDLFTGMKVMILKVTVIILHLVYNHIYKVIFNL